MVFTKMLTNDKERLHKVKAIEYGEQASKQERDRQTKMRVCDKI